MAGQSMSAPDPEKPGEFTGNLTDTTATSDEFKIIDLVRDLVDRSLVFGLLLLIVGLLLSLLGFALTWVCAVAGLGDFIRGVGGNVLAAGLVIVLFPCCKRLTRIGWLRRFLLNLRVGE